MFLKLGPATGLGIKAVDPVNVFIMVRPQGQSPAQRFLQDTLPRFIGIVLLASLSLLFFVGNGYWRLFELVPVIGILVPIILHIAAVYGLNKDRHHYPFNAASAVLYGLIEGASIGAFLAFLIGAHNATLFGYGLLPVGIGGLVLTVYARQRQNPLTKRRCFLTITVTSFLVATPILLLFTDITGMVGYLIGALLFSWFVVTEMDHIALQDGSPLEGAITMALDLVLLMPIVRSIDIQQ